MGRKPITLCLTDTHASDNNLNLQESIWAQAVELCKKLKIKRIRHLGDFVHTRKSQSLAVLKHLLWIRSYLKDEGIDFLGITGNHDRTNLESSFSYPTLLGDKGFDIVDIFKVEIIGNIRISHLSYFPEEGSYKEKLLSLIATLEKDSDKYFDILHTHIGISGGLSHKNATINKEIPIQCFEFFDRVNSGHYHNANELENDFGTSINYIGSSHATNYGEDNNKGFTIIYDDGSIEFINSEFPKFETIDVDVSEISGKWLSNTKKHIASSGNNVRLIVSGDESDLKKLKKQKFSDIGIKKVIRKNDNVSIESVDDTVAFVSLDKKAALKEYRKFCINQEIDPSFGLGYLEG